MRICKKDSDNGHNETKIPIQFSSLLIHWNRNGEKGKECENK